MSPEIAETLRDIVRERRSFIVFALPRLAGKTTVLRAILGERPPDSPVVTLAQDGQEIDELIRRSAGGYLVIPEIAQGAAMPGYIWGADVRRIFKAANEGVSLGATLHADGPDNAFAQICKGCGVPDGGASKIAFTVHLRSIGRWEEPTRRVVQSVHAVEGVENGRPKLRLLHQWDEERDEFVSAMGGAGSGRGGRA
jgi:type IV secretory pathway ATPase VirB11/archaellum biosynthesis ATPase